MILQQKTRFKRNLFG